MAAAAVSFAAVAALACWLRASTDWVVAACVDSVDPVDPADVDPDGAADADVDPDGPADAGEQSWVVYWDLSTIRETLAWAGGGRHRWAGSSEEGWGDCLRIGEI